VPISIYIRKLVTEANVGAGSGMIRGRDTTQLWPWQACSLISWSNQDPSPLLVRVRIVTVGVIVRRSDQVVELWFQWRGYLCGLSRNVFWGALYAVVWTLAVSWWVDRRKGDAQPLNTRRIISKDQLKSTRELLINGRCSRNMNCMVNRIKVGTDWAYCLHNNA
jgi:hypothetical protein